MLLEELLSRLRRSRLQNQPETRGQTTAQTVGEDVAGRAAIRHEQDERRGRRVKCLGQAIRRRLRALYLRDVHIEGSVQYSSDVAELTHIGIQLDDRPGQHEDQQGEHSDYDCQRDNHVSIS